LKSFRTISSPYSALPGIRRSDSRQTASKPLFKRHVLRDDIVFIHSECVFLSISYQSSAAMATTLTL
jgi:hypothetical protein